MTSHSLIREAEGRRVSAGRLHQLGWPHFWLLSGILAGMVALVILVFFVRLWSA